MESVERPMVLFILLVTLLSTYQNSVATQVTQEGCSVPLSGISDDSPLILQHIQRNGMSPFHMPKDPGSDALSFSSGIAVRFACPDADDNKLVIPNSPLMVYEVIAFCIKDTMFSISGASHDFKSIRCEKPPKSTLKEEGRCDIGDGKKFNIGFKLKRKFLGLIEICYDTVKEITLNTRYILSKNIDSRKNYVQSSYFGKEVTKSPTDFYFCKTQVRIIEHILGSLTQAKRYINCDYGSSMYLDGCHLAPKTDFLFGYQKDATSYYINTAPQWKTINSGNWNILEGRIRRYASRHKTDLTIVTGTMNVTTLPDNTGAERHLYLARNERNATTVPVPAMFWKLVLDRARNAAIVFVVVNNPYHHDLLAHGYIICTNICTSTTSWFDGWNRMDVNSGFVYCCTVNDFISKSGIKPFPFRAKYLLR